MKSNMRHRIFVVGWLFVSLACFPGLAQAQTGLHLGDKAPELNLPGPAGGRVSLGSLKGRIVLIDFWASWCAPCLEEQPALSALYKKYRHRCFINGNGFEIYGVSLDNKKENWTAAIKKMKISWLQVSDLKYWTSAAARIYAVEALPYNVLLDGNGTIIGIDLHGDELEKKLGGLANMKGSSVK